MERLCKASSGPEGEGNSVVVVNYHCSDSGLCVQPRLPETRRSFPPVHFRKSTNLLPHISSSSSGSALLATDLFSVIKVCTRHINTYVPNRGQIELSRRAWDWKELRIMMTQRYACFVSVKELDTILSSLNQVNKTRSLCRNGTQREIHVLQFWRFGPYFHTSFYLCQGLDCAKYLPVQVHLSSLKCAEGIHTSHIFIILFQVKRKKQRKRLQILSGMYFLVSTMTPFCISSRSPASPFSIAYV